MTRRLLFLLPVAALLTLFSCKKEKDPNYGTDPSRGYFPLVMGHYVVYDVDSTAWNSVDGTKRTPHYQMRYTVADTFRDAQLRLTYRIDVLIRKNDTSQYTTSDVFYATPTAAGLEVFQNNLRFVKLSFPVAQGASWLGNSFIATQDQDLSYFAGWNYTYTTPGQGYNNGRVNFDNTVTVNETDEAQNDPDALPTAYAYRTYSKAVYAYGVGMVYKEFVHWVYDYNPSRAVNAREGRGVIMRAIEHN